jgi:hypothetical protein
MSEYKTKLVAGENVSVAGKNPVLALEYALQKYPAVASAPHILQLRCAAAKQDEINIGAYRTNTEAIIGLIANRPSIMLLHGGGFLHTPDELSDAIFRQTAYGAAPMHEEHYDRLLHGRLPDGTPVTTYSLIEILQMTTKNKTIDEPHIIALHRDELDSPDARNVVSYNKRELEQLRKELHNISRTLNPASIHHTYRSKAGLLIAMCGGTSNTENYLTYLLDQLGNTRMQDQRFVYNHPFNAKYFQENQQPHVRAVFIQPPTIGFDLTSPLTRNAPYIALTRISEEERVRPDDVVYRTEKRPAPSVIIDTLQTYTTPEEKSQIMECVGLGRVPRSPSLDELLTKGEKIISDPKRWLIAKQALSIMYAQAKKTMPQQVAPQVNADTVEQKIDIAPIPPTLQPILETYLTPAVTNQVINRMTDLGRMPTLHDAAGIITALVPEDRQGIVLGAVKGFLQYYKK